MFSIEKTNLKDAFLVNIFHSEDKRGYFNKMYEHDIFENLGISGTLNEVFITSSKKNVIRGLHFQTLEPQVKLVSCLQGEIYDVIVDLRQDSSTYMKWQAFRLSEDKPVVLYVPKGFAHGFKTVSETCIVMYNCIGKFDKSTDTGIRFDDPSLAIDWKLSISDAIVSERDKNLPLLMK